MRAPSRGILKSVSRAARPLARALIAGHVTPNTLATAALVVAGGATAAFATGLIRLGAALLLVAVSLTFLVETVSREEGMVTTFGAFYAPALDRVGEAAVLSGLAVFFLQGGVEPGRMSAAVGLTVVALAGSLLASYMRARAETLDIAGGSLVAPRRARLFALGGATLALGAGPNGVWVFWIVAVLALVTAVIVAQQVYHVVQATRGSGRPARSRATLPGHPPAGRKGR